MSCPGCGRSLAGPPAVPTALFPDATVRRCFGCGSRLLIGDGTVQVLTSCQGCGLPFVRGIARTRRCGDCGDGQSSDPLADASVAGATESELRASLASTLKFVRAPRVTDYLERVARSLRRGVKGLDDDPRVVLFEDPCPRVLALPSASLLISSGLLRFLADEAELAFVLAHELAHVASGDAATRLVRIGLGTMATSGDRYEEPWAAAAVDVMRLGYGRAREQQADEDALERVVAE
ncbi:MAG: M48 family metalloprotease, partial [Gammaproteobacteria bacterium]|nr:M48 family metalloprotease [Gemmatimonadota bacterium]NIU78817.1 M48 family metalloprotease [Gammaproteobacteria bacterium]